MMSKKVQSLRWFWDQESDALIAKIRENSDEEMYSHYSIEWKGNPDKWVAFFEGVEIGTGNLLHCLEICKNDHQQQERRTR